MFQPLKNIQIQRKVQLLIMAASALAIVVAAVTITVYQSYRFTQDVKDDLQDLADVVALYSEAPLDFDDPIAARETLASLRANDEIVAAAILRKDNTLLARYPADPKNGDTRFQAGNGQNLILNAPVRRAEGEHLGTLVLEADITDTLYGYYWNAAGICALVMFLAGLVSFVASGPLQRLVVNPILHLTETARLVTGGRNFGVRAVKETNDEVGQLIDAFNEMLHHIEQREVQLRDSENQYHSLVDNVNVGIVRFGATERHTVIKANPAAAQILCIEESGKLIGRSFIRFPENQKQFLRLLAEGRNQPGMTHHEIPIATAEGNRAWVKFGATAQLDKQGDTLWYDCVFEDVTERRRAEDELRQYQEHLEDLVQQRTQELEMSNTQLQRIADQLAETNEELKSFAYIVSHDLRAPLVNLKGFVSELKLSLADIEEVLEKAKPYLSEQDRNTLEEAINTDVAEALDFITTSTTRMDALLNAILKLSRVGRRDLKYELVDPNEVVAKVRKALAHQLEEKNVKLDAGRLPPVVADYLSLDQIFGNLLDNAIKFSEPDAGGVIRVWAETDDFETKFFVADNGRGIEPENLQKIFEVFRRVGKQDRPGEGMGLAYVRTLVRRHGGEITCDSAPGEGTTFCFTVKHGLSASNAKEAPRAVAANQ